MATKTPEEILVYHREWTRQNPEKVEAIRSRYQKSRSPAQKHEYWLRHYHKMTPEDYAAMITAQGACCYLCGDPLQFTSSNRKRSVIEHDHRCCPEGYSCSSCRRGMACQKCNILIGLAGDDPTRLRLIADRLETALSLLKLEGK